MGSVIFGALSLLEPPLRLSWFPRNPVGPPAVRPLPRLAGSLKCIDTSTGVTLRPDVLIFSITSYDNDAIIHQVDHMIYSTLWLGMYSSSLRENTIESFHWSPDPFSFTVRS